MDLEAPGGPAGRRDAAPAAAAVLPPPFGSAVAAEVAPQVEPQLCADQAARTGGHCGPNIRLAFRHLAGTGVDPPPPRPELWERLLGPAAPAAAACAAEAGACVPRGRATLFSDEAQAFERLSLAWFTAVLARWGLPVRVRRSFLALVCDRCVRTLGAGGRGPIRRLLRSLGMGGTASPLGWGMAFDPVVEIVGTTVGVRRPTYVDDMMCLTDGAERTVKAFVVLLFAGHAAGLLVRVHACRWLRIETPTPSVRALLADLPVEVAWDDGAALVRGLTPEIAAAVVAAAGHPPDLGEVVVEEGRASAPCRMQSSPRTCACHGRGPSSALR